jgi:hypothetical protein
LELAVLVAFEVPAVVVAFEVPAVVIARVTDVMRSVWLRVSACWSRWICCCVGAVRRAPRQALIAASDGAAEVVIVAALVGTGPPVEGRPLVGGAVVAVVVDAAEAEEPDGEGSEGKNGTHWVSAADACARSAVMAPWALVTRCWT